MDNISISLSEGGHNREVSELRVDGVIDTLTATELEQVMDSLLRRRRYKIVVDLAGVDYISSAGWGIFISHIKEVRENDGDVKLANMVPDVQEIFELLEFDKILQTCHSVDQAVEIFTGKAPAPSKKKEEAPTRLTVVDDIDVEDRSAPSQAPEITPESSASTDEDLHVFALRMVRNDPFASIRDISREGQRRSTRIRAGWWSVFGVLRRSGLLSKRARFRYAWGRP